MSRTKRVELLMTEAEYNRLVELASQDPDSKRKSGKTSLGAYIRSCVFESARQTSLVSRELRDLTFQVRKIGVNINQAVYNLNAGMGGQKDTDSLVSSMDKIEQLMEKILEKVEVSANGDHEDAPHWRKQL